MSEVYLIEKDNTGAALIAGVIGGVIASGAKDEKKTSPCLCPPPIVVYQPDWEEIFRVNFFESFGPAFGNTGSARFDLGGFFSIALKDIGSAYINGRFLEVACRVVVSDPTPTAGTLYRFSPVVSHDKGVTYQTDPALRVSITPTTDRTEFSGAVPVSATLFGSLSTGDLVSIAREVLTDTNNYEVRGHVVLIGRRPPRLLGP